MGTVKQTADNGSRTKNLRFRGADGKFAKGNRASKGRPPGSANQTTVDLRELRREIAAAYGACDGAAIMRRLAEQRPQDFMRVVVSCLPKEDRLELTAGRSVEINIVRDPSPDEVLGLIRACLKRAGKKRITKSHVTEVMREAIGETHDRLTTDRPDREDRMPEGAETPTA